MIQSRAVSDLKHAEHLCTSFKLSHLADEHRELLNLLLRLAPGVY